MKHLALCGALAALLAALLAGCGAKTAASALPAGSRELKSTPPDSMHATAAITEQYTLEKVVQAENGAAVRLNIHLPQLECDSADAARPIKLRRKGSGQWLLWEQYLMTGIRIPLSADPWA